MIKVIERVLGPLAVERDLVVVDCCHSVEVFCKPPVGYVGRVFRRGRSLRPPRSGRGHAGGVYVCTVIWSDGSLTLYRMVGSVIEIQSIVEVPLADPDCFGRVCGCVEGFVARVEGKCYG